MSETAAKRGAIVRACTMAFGSLWIASCSFATSFDGLAGRDSAEGGAQSDSGPSGASDGSATALDGAMSPDNDAGSITTAACTPTAILCDSFDMRTTLQGPWNGIAGPDTGANASIAAQHAVSPPNAFGVDSQPTTSHEDAFLVAYIPYGSLKANQLRIDFDMALFTDVTGFGPNADADYAEVLQLVLGPDLVVDLGVKRSLGLFVGYGDFTTKPATIKTVSVGAPSNATVHVSMMVVFSAQQGRVTWTIGGAPPQSAPVVNFRGPDQFSLYLGLGLNGTCPHTSVYLDNVVVQ